MKRKLSLLAAMTLLALAVSVAVTMASPPSGVTPTVLARGTYDAFKVKSSPNSPVDFKAKAKSPIDLVVRRHDYAVGSTTGWHTHPGPVFITVTVGQLTEDVVLTPVENELTAHAGLCAAVARIRSR